MGGLVFLEADAEAPRGRPRPPRGPAARRRSFQRCALVSYRTLQSDWCISYKTRWFQLGKIQPKILTKGSQIEIREELHGSIHLWPKGQELTWIQPRISHLDSLVQH